MVDLGGDDPKVLLDFEFLLTAEALDWMESPELRPSVVVSAALVDLLANDGQWVDEFGPRPEPERLSRLLQSIGSVEQFSHREFTSLPATVESIRTALVDDGPLGQVFADEWVYLATQSIGVFELKAQTTIDAFRRAGGTVYMVADATFTRGLEAVQHRLPRWLLNGMKRVGRFPFRRIPKLIVLGGTIAGLMIPTIGAPLAIATAVQQGAGLIAGDP